MREGLADMALDHLTAIRNALHDRDISKHKMIPFSTDSGFESSGALPLQR